MKDASHEAFTRWVFDFLAQEYPYEPYFKNYARANVRSAIGTDYTAQSPGIEIVFVWGDKDNPHGPDEWGAIDDDPLTQAFGSDFATINHYIDIGKGPGIFDDYDGYSYNRGSAKNNDYQTLGDFLHHDKPDKFWGASGVLGWLLEKLEKLDLDTPLEKAKYKAFSYGNLYVHAPGTEWYKGCSPAIEKYSMYRDKGIYGSIEDEARARFRSFSDSVFMPIDNIARYWYDEFTRDRERNQAALGTIMHVIQDCSVPHHASGYGGSWHNRYEAKLNDNSSTLLADTGPVKELLNKWNWVDPHPPTSLGINDWTKTPAKNWRIDMLATWVALNAHKECKDTYGNFRNGFNFNIDSAINLSNLARAMCAFVAIKAVNPRPPIKPNDPVPQPPRVPTIDIRTRIIGPQGHRRFAAHEIQVSSYDPNGDDIKYQFEIIKTPPESDEANFTGQPTKETTWISWKITDTNWTGMLKLNPPIFEPHIVRVRAIDKTGRYSQWSDPIEFGGYLEEIPDELEHYHGGPGSNHPENP